MNNLDVPLYKKTHTSIQHNVHKYDYINPLVIRKQGNVSVVLASFEFSIKEINTKLFKEADIFKKYCFLNFLTSYFG